MSKSTRHLTFMLSCMWLMPAAFVQAQAQSERPAQTAQTVKKVQTEEDEFLEIDKIITRAARNVANRYNLNEEQRQYTEDLMRSRVRAFIDQNRKQVWPVLRELLKYQTGDSPPDPEVARRIGRAALPLFAEAKQAILDGNKEWRGILTPAQKDVHDFDMRETEKTFGAIAANLERWKNGQVSGKSIFPPPRKLVNQPRRPSKPPVGIPKPVQERMRSLAFVHRVDGFIEQYHLDAAQIKSARSIQAEIVGKAESYLRSQNDELLKIESAKREANHKGQQKKADRLEAKRRELLQPFYALFDKLDTRLRDLLTSQQIALYGDPNDARPKTAAKASPASEKEATGRKSAPAPAPKSAGPVPKKKTGT